MQFFCFLSQHYQSTLVAQSHPIKHPILFRIFCLFLFYSFFNYYFFSFLVLLTGILRLYSSLYSFVVLPPALQLFIPVSQIKDKTDRLKCIIRSTVYIAECWAMEIGLYLCTDYASLSWSSFSVVSPTLSLSSCTAFYQHLITSHANT